MRALKILTAPFAYRLWQKRQLKAISADLFGRGAASGREHRPHLEAALAWLCVAQDARNGSGDAGGVSAGWNFGDGWLPGYPETTGYIVETFIAASRFLSRPDLMERAQRMIDWELSLQQSDGAFPGHHAEPGSKPVIFNTGQIIHGMVAGYAEMGRDECLGAALRASHWLARNLEHDGCWRQFEYNDIPHVYNTRVAWAMLRVAGIAGDSTLRLAAIRNLDWALRQQSDCGWFANNAFTAQSDPHTHTIAYAIRGFLESGLLLGNEIYVAAALKAARALARAQRIDGWLAGTYGDDWQPTATYSCLTGEAQMALCWLRMADACQEQSMRVPARRAIDHVKTAQRLNDPDPVLNGAIPGSLPIWGAYARFEYPNWAAKFFADALMMDSGSPAIPAAHRRDAILDTPEQCRICR